MLRTSNKMIYQKEVIMKKKVIFFKILSAVIGISLASANIVGVSANNNADLDFSVYANTENKLIATKVSLPPTIRDSYLNETAYFASNESRNYVAFRRKTDTTSVYVEVTSTAWTNRAHNKAKKVLLRVVSPIIYKSSYEIYKNKPKIITKSRTTFS